MIDTLIRIVAIADLAVIIGAGAYLHQGYRDAVPAPVWRAGLAIGAYLGLSAVALVANVLAHPPLTPAAPIIAGGGALCAAYVLRCAVRAALGDDR